MRGFLRNVWAALAHVSRAMWLTGIVIGSMTWVSGWWAGMPWALLLFLGIPLAAAAALAVALAGVAVKQAGAELPHIICDGCDRSDPRVMGGGRARFLHVRFKNDRIRASEHATARHVWIEVSFFTADRSRLLFRMEGRWSNTPAPSSGAGPLRSFVDMPPNGYPEPLDIAIGYEGEATCYGYNNEAIRLHPQSRHPPYALEPGTYAVKVQLGGVGLDNPVWWFTLNNAAEDFNIEPAA